MEEKKEPKEVKRHKLTYEELENVAKQITMQADQVFEENKKLKSSLQQMAVNNAYTELGFRFKVLDYNKLFPEEFVKSCIEAIINVMTPVKEEEKDGTTEG